MFWLTFYLAFGPYLDIIILIMYQSEAEKEGLVDAHLLNGMLRVHTNSGRIEPALRFYETEFKKHGMVSASDGWICLHDIMFMNHF